MMRTGRARCGEEGGSDGKSGGDDDKKSEADNQCEELSGRSLEQEPIGNERDQSLDGRYGGDKCREKLAGVRQIEVATWNIKWFVSSAGGVQLVCPVTRFT
eukprot:6191189-Pleurochrysis_carterae.AAC.2